MGFPDLKKRDSLISPNERQPMTQSYSADLRSRVIQAGLNGLSARAAAKRFDVGPSTAIVWIRRFRESGESLARRQGKPKGARLDAHEEFILGLVEETKDISLAEIAACLEVEHGLRVGITSVWTFLDRHGLTFKKRQPMRLSSSARM